MIPFLDRKEVVRGLIDVVSAAIAHGQLDDAETTLSALRILRPRMTQLDSLEASIDMKRGDFQKAIQVLSALEQSTPDWEWARAMRIFCQWAVGDKSWKPEAQLTAQTFTKTEPRQFMERMLDITVPASEQTEPAAETAVAPMLGDQSFFMRA